MVDVISIHIPKTAGSTAFQALKKIYSDQEVFVDATPFALDSAGIHEPISLHCVPMATRIIHGHISVDRYNKMFPSAKKIVWVRNPIVRMISHYFYAQTEEAIKIAPGQAKMNIIEFANLYKNIMFLMTGGEKLNDFYFVGVTEFFQDDLRELLDLLDCSTKTNYFNSFNLNSYPGYHDEVIRMLSDKNLIAQLLDINRKDIQLYQNALNLRANRKGYSDVLEMYQRHLELTKCK